MKRTLKLNLPDTDDITARLEQLACYLPLQEAEKELANAEAVLSDARRRLEDATATVDALPAKISSGDAPHADLETAISKQRATEFMVPEFERALSDAEEALAEAKRQARAAVVEEARRRRNELQGIADEISPILEELRELEIALLEALRVHAPEPIGDPAALSQARKLAPPLDAVKWEVSLAGERRLMGGSAPGTLINTRQ